MYAETDGYQLIDLWMIYNFSKTSCNMDDEDEKVVARADGFRSWPKVNGIKAE